MSQMFIDPFKNQTSFMQYKSIKRHQNHHIKEMSEFHNKDCCYSNRKTQTVCV